MKRDATTTVALGLVVALVLGTTGYVVAIEPGVSNTVDPADTANPQASNPADFQVQNLDAPERVAEGDTVDVSARVVNEGGRQGTQTVAFRVDTNTDGNLDAGEGVASRSVTLDAGESTTITFEDVDTSGLDPGTYTHGVFTDNDSATAQIEVSAALELPNFQLSNLQAPDSATQGDAIDVSVDVTNEGELPAGKEVEFRVDTDGDGSISDESAVAERNPTLNEGQTETVTFENVDTSGFPVGTVTHGFVTEDDSITAQLTITAPAEPANFQVSDLDVPSTRETVDSIDAAAVVENTGDRQGTQTVEFRLDSDSDGSLDADDTLASQEVTLQAGEKVTVGFEDIELRQFAPGEYAVGVFTDNDSETTEIGITEPLQPANYQLSDLQAPDSATQGDAIDVSVDVTNEGDFFAGKDVEFRVDTDGDGSISDESAAVSRAIPLDAGATETVTFEDVDTSGLPTGTVTHGFVTEDDSITAQITITAPTEPANFQVSNLDAPSTVTRGESITVSADVRNTGEQEGTQTVSFRVDTSGNGEIEADEALASHEVTLGAGETTTVSFDGLDTEPLAPGDYLHGVFSADDAATATITVEAPARPDVEYTRDEIAQAKYGLDFDDLSVETTGQVQAIFNRQPFPDGTTPAAIETREEIAERKYGVELEESTLYDVLTRSQVIEVQNAYDAQFADE